MGLKNSTDVNLSLTTYGVRVEKRNGGESPTEVFADLKSVVWTSDASPGECMFLIPDPSGSSPSGCFVPDIGSEIDVWINPPSNCEDNEALSPERLIFHGIVEEQSHRSSDSGSFYTVRCADMKRRMDDICVMKSYNHHYDIVGHPNFDEANVLTTPLDCQLWDVMKIVEDLFHSAEVTALEFDLKYKPYTFFEYGDIDFSQVPELSGYIPESLTFDNISLGEAVYRTISSAGSYRMVYDHESDKIRITRLSIGASGCGPKVDVSFPAQLNGGDLSAYADEVNVMSDNTVRRVSDLATVYRVYGSPVEWYSGHFHVASGIQTYVPPSGEGEGYVPSLNWDGYQYIPTDNGIMPTGFCGVVGMPLYPSWDPSKGYGPAKKKVERVVKWRDGTYGASGVMASGSWEENQGFSALDQAFPGSESFVRDVGEAPVDNAFGLLYEAWMPYPGPCPYCQGKGAVKAIVGDWSDSFGASRDAGGGMSKDAMEPFDYSGSGSQAHPVPWLNTCPACRGVGMEPNFKVTNILDSLMDVPLDRMKLKDAKLAASGVAKTWDELAKEYNYSYGPRVHVEQSTQFAAASWTASGTMPHHSLAEVRTLVGDTKKDIFSTDEEKSVRKIFHTQITEAGSVTIDHKRGNVMFPDRMGVLCAKDFKAVKEVEKPAGSGKFYLVQNSTEGDSTVYDKSGDGIKISGDTLCFWRPPRAWVTCYFNRPAYRDDTLKTGVATIFPSGTQDFSSYRAAFRIDSGRPVVEVSKIYSGANEFVGRPVIKGETIDDHRWQVHPADYKAIPTPSGASDSWEADGYKLRSEAGYIHPFGEIAVSEGLRQSEANVLGVSGEIVMRPDTFIKPFKWIHRDDRYKLACKAARELERRNDIQISGDLTLKGMVYGLDEGMGYVEFPDGRKACVVKVEHSFSDGFMTSLELTTEELRVGDKRESEKDYSRTMEMKILRPKYDSWRGYVPLAGNKVKSKGSGGTDPGTIY
jgi:hypothetical protein